MRDSKDPRRSWHGARCGPPVIALLVGIMALLGLPGPGASQGVAPEAPSAPDAPRSLVHLPFFSGPDVNLTEQALDTYSDWSRKILADAIKKDHPAFSVVDFTDGAAPDSLVDLAGNDVRKATQLLGPLAKLQKAEGALAVWLEKSSQGEYQIGLRLYLPNGIQLNDFQVSTNVERQRVPLNDKRRIEKDAFGAALREALKRNLARAVAPPPPTPTEAPVEDAGGTGDPAGEAAPAPEPASPQDPEEEAGPEPASSGPSTQHLTVGLLPFSYEFDLPDSHRDRAAMMLEMLRRITDEWSVVQSIKPLQGPTFTSTQMRAPTLVLDPNADPKARERRLAQICRDNGVDALFFGHLRQSDGGPKGPRGLTARLFLPQNLQLFEGDATWKKGELSEALREAATTAFQEASLVSGPAFFLYEVQNDDLLYEIARKCFGNEVGRAVRSIGRLNKIKNINLIHPGEKLKIPSSVNGVPLRRGDCK